MEVNLVSYSQPDGNFLIDSASAMEMVAFCARVSNPENQLNTETSERLLKFLIKHKHWSPFEMVSACMEIKTTRDIARQILRHRSFSFQEFSQRYAVADKFVYREARLQDPKNRQNSIELDLDNMGKGGNKTQEEMLAEKWMDKQRQVIETAKEAYTWALEQGIAKEQARCVLPEGNTVSTMYVNGTLRSWIHFIELRSGHGTQKEHQLIAKACGEAISKIFPSSVWHQDWSW